MPASDNKPADEFSKSKRKLEMLALQAIGKSLIDLPANQLAKVPLPDDLRELIEFAHTLKSHEAIRRHLQFIGKKMRHVDVEQIQDAVAKIKFGNAQATAEFHVAEQWRDRLIAEGDDALNEFLTAHPTADRQQFRQLIRKAQQDKKTEKNSGAATQLFRSLRDLLG